MRWVLLVGLACGPCLALVTPRLGGLQARTRNAVRAAAPIARPPTVMAATALEPAKPTAFERYTQVSSALTNLFPVWTVLFSVWVPTRVVHFLR